MRSNDASDFRCIEQLQHDDEGAGGPLGTKQYAVVHMHVMPNAAVHLVRRELATFSDSEL